MRILVFILLSGTFMMCKSKSAIQKADLLNYVVILKGENTPKAMKKDISADLVDFNKRDNAANLWTLSFYANDKNGQALMAELLNHPMVVSALTLDQYEKIQLKKQRKSPNGSKGKRTATRQ